MRNSSANCLCSELELILVPVWVADLLAHGEATDLVESLVHLFTRTTANFLSKNLCTFDVNPHRYRSYFGFFTKRFWIHVILSQKLFF